MNKSFSAHSYRDNFGPDSLISRLSGLTWFWFAAFLTLYAVGFGLFPAQPLPLDLLFANVVLIGVALFPLVLWKARGSRDMPLFEIICVAYGVQFGLATQLLPNTIVILSQRITLSSEVLSQATWLSVLGVSGLIVGYNVAKGNPVLRAVKTLDLPLHRRYSLFYLAAAPFLNILFAAARKDTQWGALATLMSGQLYLAIVLLTLAFYTPHRRTRLLTFLWVAAVAVAVVVGLSSGFLEKAAAPLALVILARWHATRKFPFSLVVPLLLVFTLLNFVKAAYRQEAWYGTRTGRGGIGLWWDLASENASSVASGKDSAGAGNALGARFDLVHKFAWVLKNTPSSVPYYGGATYSYLLYGWIPRFVWPDKPSASGDAAYRMDYDYQLVPAEAIGKTNIGIGFLPEAFANFGPPGVFFVMFLQGAVFAFLNRLLNGPYSEGGRAIYLAVMVFFLNGIGSSTVTLFGALLQIVLANAVILRFISVGWRVLTPAERARMAADNTPIFGSSR